LQKKADLRTLLSIQWFVQLGIDAHGVVVQVRLVIACILQFGPQAFNLFQ
jgi:hypothetical protein